MIGIIWIKGGKGVKRMGLAIRWTVDCRDRIGDIRHGTICEKHRPMIEFINEGGACKTVSGKEGSTLQGIT